MKKLNSRERTPVLLLAAMMLCLCGSLAGAEGLSGDDSLSSLGISTPIVSIDPEFYYSTIEYDVVVPAGTESISLDPVPSDANATISGISGTELDDDGKTTVQITVTAPAGNSYSYYLYVESEDQGAALRAAREAAVLAEKETEAPTEKETEPETEDSRYVSVARDTLEEAENTIEALKEETTLYRDRGNMLLRILYALIGLCVILLFIVINLLLRNREVRSELNEYRSLEYSAELEQRTPEEEEILPEEVPVKGVQESYFEEEEQEQTAKDDPDTVPRPSEAKKRTKKMPKYESPQQASYEPSKSEEEKKKSETVDVEYIDL